MDPLATQPLSSDVLDGLGDFFSPRLAFYSSSFDSQFGSLSGAFSYTSREVRTERKFNTGRCYLSLERELASKLNLPPRSGGGDLAERCAAVCGVHARKVRMVECVEHFCAELEPEPLCN